MEVIEENDESEIVVYDENDEIDEMVVGDEM